MMEDLQCLFQEPEASAVENFPKGLQECLDKAGV